MFGHIFRCVDRSQDIDIINSLPVISRLFFQRGHLPCYPCYVAEDVDFGVGLKGQVDQLFDIFFIGHTRLFCDALPALLLNELQALIQAVDILIRRQHDLGPFSRKKNRCGPTNSAGCPRDNGHLPL